MYLQNFGPSEFKNKHGDWWPRMSRRLLVMLDVARFQHGAAITISPSPYALGRSLPATAESEHNVTYWGEVCAADVFVDGVYTEEETREFVSLAQSIGFTGIGVYTDTTNHKGEEQVMFHLGVRDSERMGSPATWGRVDHDYTSLIAAVQLLKAG